MVEHTLPFGMCCWFIGQMIPLCFDECCVWEADTVQACCHISRKITAFSACVSLRQAGHSCLKLHDCNTLQLAGSWQKTYWNMIRMNKSIWKWLLFTNCLTVVDGDGVQCCWIFKVFYNKQTKKPANQINQVSIPKSAESLGLGWFCKQFCCSPLSPFAVVVPTCILTFHL